MALLAACGETVDVGFDNELVTGGSAAGGGGTGGAGGLQLGGSISEAGTGATPTTGGEAPCVPVQCRGKTLFCGDCIDNDGDGLIDSADPDCLGPCDDDEVGLSTGLTSLTVAVCRLDCYFDGDAGPGNDKCEWNHACDPLSVPPNYPPSGEARCAYDANKPPMGVDCQALSETQPQACLDNCLPLVPNGCDCFGCCLLQDGNYHYVGHGRGDQGCQRDHLDDVVACPPCTYVKSCYNDCAPCETCVGKLPDPSCAPNGGCKAGQRACDANSPCDVGDYCVTGCCVRAPPPT